MLYWLSEVYWFAIMMTDSKPMPRRGVIFVAPGWPRRPQPQRGVILHLMDYAPLGLGLLELFLFYKDYALLGH